MKATELETKKEQKLGLMKKLIMDIQTLEERKADSAKGFNEQIKSAHEKLAALAREDDDQFEFTFEDAPVV